MDLTTGYRLINSKYPPKSLFDDVADADEFETIYAYQSLSNPRLQNELGNLQLIPTSEIPFGIPGCNMATEPFTHVNAEGTRFSDGRFGVLYIAETIETAVAEVHHHQNLYWLNVPGLEYDRFVFRGLCVQFTDSDCEDLTRLPASDSIYDLNDYSAARARGWQLKQQKRQGVYYNSVRRPGNVCWGLFTPNEVASCVQTSAYQMVWNGSVTSVDLLVS